jgi:membrane-bound lytic murein transglycosylase D
MNRNLSYFLLLLLVLALLLGTVVFQQQQRDVSLPGTNKQYYKIVPLTIPDTFSFAGEPVPLDIFYVREALDNELSVNTYWHSSTLQLIKRAHRWLPLIDTILAHQGIPLDFRYMPMVESGFQNVVSPAGAVGFWQLLKSTAKEYGLQVNSEVDERYNVEKATRAACRYLKKSYQKFGSWALVIASYNAGQNRIVRFMKQQKAQSFYDLLVADETSRYIYRMMALKMIFEHPRQYGFYIEPSQEYPVIPTHTVKVTGAVKSWADFAHARGISYKLLKYFNPWLRKTSLKNPHHKTYQIKIPDAPFNLTDKKLKE